MIKILANDGISEAGKELLEKNGFLVSTENVPQEKLAETINKEGYAVLLVRSATKVRKDLIDVCPGLKIIGRGGVGMDNIDVEYARSKGIEVINTPAASSQSVAELVMAHLFGCVRFLYDANRQMPLNGNTEFKQLKKKYAKGIELRGKKLGIIGFGRIGQSVASYALGIGMEVLPYDRSCKSAEIKLSLAGNTEVSITVNTVSFNDVLAKSDFITLHVPAQEKPVIGSDEFSKMKDGAILINAARGGVVDEQAMIQALNTGKLAAAGVDVFDNEPTPDSAVLQYPKVSLSPHIGAATIEAQDRIGVELAQKIMDYFG
jgi:D-3-phosphoglycerate dehydrogenase